MTSAKWVPQSEPGGPQDAPMPMPDLIWQILRHRGLHATEQIQEHFSPSLQNLRDPFSLDQMDVATERLLRAHENQEAVAIYGDFDLDGTSGLALIKDGFRQLGFQNLHHYQPSRLKEGYGLHPEALQKLRDEGVSLVVTVDVGITAMAAAEKAKELGMDLIITDHHLPKEVLPEALAIVNPNKGFCESGLGHLCGAGVGFYLVLATKMALQKKGVSTEAFDAKSLLDCFAIGTLTDLVPLIGENRILVKHGLVELAKTKRPGLRSLLQALKLWGRPLTSQDVAIRFAPKLNALSRLENGILPLDIFLEEDEEKAKSLVGQVIRNNEKRVSMQAEAEQEAEAFLEQNPPQTFILVVSENFHQGVVGLVATKLSQKYGLPAFVGAQHPSGTIVGSARAPQGSTVLAALEAGASTLNQFGGHTPAAGFEMQADNVEALRGALADFYSDGALPSDFELAYAARGRIDQIDAQFMKWYEAMGPFGNSFEIPLLVIEDLEIQTQRRLKEKHLKFQISSPLGGKAWEALWFSPPEDHPSKPFELAPSDRVDLLVEPQWNHFAGRKTLQLLIKDLRPRVN